MDSEALRVSFAHSKLETEHFKKGGYFSPDVRERAEHIKELGETEKQELYKDTFTTTQELVSRFQQSSRYTPNTGNAGGTIDLSEEGFGVIDIAIAEFEDESLTSPAFTAISVSAEAFHPVAEPFTDQTEPVYWEEGLYATKDGLLPADMADDLDLHIMRALDFVETLRIVEATLNGRAET
jgi:hypothetical protein